MKLSDTEESCHISGEWYINAFGFLYPIIYAHRTVESALPEVRFAGREVQLKASDRVLDLCCGMGRHLTALQGSSAELIGVDYSSELLALARNQVASSTALFRADMRYLPFSAGFDVIFSFFTSFGYFFDDADNVRTAKEMGRVLRTGGRFFMDYLNPAHVLGTLQPKSVRVIEDYTIHEKRWIDHVARRVNKRVDVFRGEKHLGHTAESVRLYDFNELTDVLAQAGLRIENCWGDCYGATYSEKSPRMILAGVKAGI